MTKTTNILGYLPTFLDKETDSNNYKFIKSFEEDLDDISAQIVNLKESIQLNTAAGDELDSIGIIFLLPRRGGESDSNYRARIKGYWPGYSGGGTVNSIKSTINRMAGIDESDITITEYPDSSISSPLKFKVSANVGFSSDIVTLKNVLAYAKAAGTYIIFDLVASITDTYADYDDVTTITDSTNTWIYPDIYVPGLLGSPL